MKYTRNEIERKLEDYPAMEREIAVLQFELEHPAMVSEDEMREAMTFARGDGIGGAKGHISDKTMYIALNYRQAAERANQETVSGVSTRLLHLKQEVNRLKYYVSLLDRRQSQVLRRSYFEQMTNEEVAKEMNLAARTVQEIKKRAIDSLTEMYNYVSDLRQ